jgi:hypothetical protein
MGLFKIATETNDWLGGYQPLLGNFQNELGEMEHWWLMPIILATWKADIERLQFKGSLGQK